MNRITGVVLILSLFSFPVFSQTHQEETVIPCFANEMMDELWINHPELHENIKQSEAQQAAFRKQFAKDFHQKEDQTFIIPVVFHVIHDGGSENISPAQIQNAIDNMNIDFAAQTAGMSSVRSEFANLVANTGIQFALAKRDPEGNCTNGIIRTQSITTYTGGENLKEVSPVWDRARYLNIWVCQRIESGAAGYSRYPSSVNSTFGAQIDGIVVRHDYVGAIGTASSSAIHTLTHEAGHWLDLAHTWGSSNQPGLESNCEIDDGVEDTPNTIGWNVCNLSGESCGSLDNVQNFMEYSYCSKMFTLGQAQRMLAALNSPVADRNNLWTEENLIFTGVLEEDTPCKADFIANQYTVCVGEEVTFSDYSYSGITERTWIFEGGNPVIQQGAAPVVTYAQPGLYGVTLAASNEHGAVSVHKSALIRVLDTARIATPFSEDFENITSVNNEQSQRWYTESTMNNPHWEITNEASFSGNKSIRVTGLDANKGASSTILSQTFDMTGFDSTKVTLRLRYAAKRKNNNSDDKLRIYISRNCGDHWTMRKELKGETLYTVEGTQNTPFVPQGLQDWREVLITNVLPMFFTSEFRIKIELETSNGNNVYIDDINLFDPLTTVDVADINQLKNWVKIFPNPTNGDAEIELNAPSESGSLNVEMYDISGRLVKHIYDGRVSAGNQQFTIHGANLPAGMYFVKFNTPHGSFTEKLIINK